MDIDLKNHLLGIAGCLVFLAGVFGADRLGLLKSGPSSTELLLAETQQCLAEPKQGDLALVLIGEPPNTEYTFYKLQKLNGEVLTWVPHRKTWTASPTEQWTSSPFPPTEFDSQHSLQTSKSSLPSRTLQEPRGNNPRLSIYLCHRYTP